MYLVKLLKVNCRSTVRGGERRQAIFFFFLRWIKVWESVCKLFSLLSAVRIRKFSFWLIGQAKKEAHKQQESKS